MLDYPTPRDIEELQRTIGRLEKQLRVANDLNAELGRNHGLLIELCTTDHLTRLKNRRHFDESLSSAISFATRHRLPLSVAMVDVDDGPVLDVRLRTNDDWRHVPAEYGAVPDAPLLAQGHVAHDGRGGRTRCAVRVRTAEGPGQGRRDGRRRRLQVATRRMDG